MNKQAAATVEALRGALPFEPPGMLLWLAVFGSQARGTERPDSDLDILYVSRGESGELYRNIDRTVYGAPGGVRTATIFGLTPEEMKERVRLYGTFEYDILREIHPVITLYTSDDAAAEMDGIRSVASEETDYGWCAWRWLEMAERDVAGCREKPHMSCGLRCSWMHGAVGSAVRSCLLSAGVKFPFTRDLRALHDMLPPERRMTFLDFDALAYWRRYSSLGAQNYTEDDASRALDAAQKACDFAGRIMRAGDIAVPAA